MNQMDNYIKATREKLSVLVDGRREVMEEFDFFAQDLRMTMVDQDIYTILDAVIFAADKHRMQKRKGPQAIPYIIHPIGVAYHLLKVGHVRDRDVLIGALLHDTVEDTDTTFEEIEKAFGFRVEGLVREMTDDKTLPKAERKRLQIVNAPHLSPGAAQIKLGDKYINLKDLLKNPPADWTQERIEEYFHWAHKVVDNLPQVNVALKLSVDEIIANGRM